MEFDFTESHVPPHLQAWRDYLAGKKEDYKPLDNDTGYYAILGVKPSDAHETIAKAWGQLRNECSWAAKNKDSHVNYDHLKAAVADLKETYYPNLLLEPNRFIYHLDTCWDTSYRGIPEDFIKGKNSVARIFWVRLFFWYKLDRGIMQTRSAKFAGDGVDLLTAEFKLDYKDQKFVASYPWGDQFEETRNKNRKAAKVTEKTLDELRHAFKVMASKFLRRPKRRRDPDKDEPASKLPRTEVSNQLAMTMENVKQLPGSGNNHQDDDMESIAESVSARTDDQSDDDTDEVRSHYSDSNLMRPQATMAIKQRSASSAKPEPAEEKTPPKSTRRLTHSNPTSPRMKISDDLRRTKLETVISGKIGMGPPAVLDMPSLGTDEKGMEVVESSTIPHNAVILNTSWPATLRRPEGAVIWTAAVRWPFDNVVTRDVFVYSKPASNDEPHHFIWMPSVLSNVPSELLQQMQANGADVFRKFQHNQFHELRLTDQTHGMLFDAGWVRDAQKHVASVTLLVKP